MQDASSEPRGFLPAAGRAPLALYDAGIALTMRERILRRRLVEQVLDGVDAPDVLDVGCGTGTLAIMLAARGAHVVGVDPDERALERARRKPGAETVRWVRGDVRELPTETASVDRVVFSLVLHHLDDALKASALAHARRVLRAGGRVHVADWTTPGDPLMRLGFLGVQLLDGRTGTASLARGELPAMLKQAGFGEIVEHDRLRTPFGRVAFVAASAP